MRLVVLDASVVIDAFVGVSPSTGWAQGVVAGNDLAAPHLLPVECASALRRAAARGAVDPVDAQLALRDITDTPVELFPFFPVRERVWQLRESITAYDAWYAALAEALDAPLVTLDRRLARVAAPYCTTWTPPR